MKLNRLPLLFIIFFIASVISCSSDEEEEPIEKKVVTTLNLTLGTSGGISPVMMTYVDLDGTGGNAPQVQGGVLKANTLYFGELEILNESVSPVEKINNEINLSGTDYQVFFVANGIDITVIYADSDADGNPIGLITAITTGNPGSGTLTINLKRGLNKFSPGVSDGLLANASGVTDIQATFSVTIE